MITAGIKPGTASRLGLRKPQGPLLGVIRLPPLTDEQVAAFKKAFEADMWKPHRWLVQSDAEVSPYPPLSPIRRYWGTGEFKPKPPPPRHEWLEVTESHRERRRRLGLHWWQREAK